MATVTLTSSDSTPVTVSCHCGRIAITVPDTPVKLNECRCSLCYRYGVVWAYYLRSQVTITSPPGEPSHRYVRSDAVADGDLGFFRCGHCGCVTHWEGIADTPKRKGPTARVGVNWRMAPEVAMQGIEKVVT